MTKLTYTHPDAQRFGAVIYRLRDERRMQQQVLARKIGVSRQHLASLEKGRNFPSLLTLFDLADVLNVTAASIVEEVEKARKG